MSERVLRPESVASSVIEEHIGRSGMRFSSVVEIGHVQFKSQESEDPGPSGSIRSSRSSNRVNKEVEFLVLSQQIESFTGRMSISTPRERSNLKENPSFEAALDRSFVRSGNHKSHLYCRAAPFFQMSGR